MPASIFKKPKVNQEREELIELLRQAQQDLDDARVRFDEATQPELIEQCVFEINALLARQAYFWRMIREGGDNA